MNKIEKFFLGCVIGALPPLTAFLIAWWSMYTVLTGWKIIAIPVAAALFGLVVDAFQLKRWIEGAYRTRWSAWVVVYLFYSTCVFGFFMGVPVFNLVLALPAGFYISCRLVAQKVVKSKEKRSFCGSSFLLPSSPDWSARHQRSWRCAIRTRVPTWKVCSGCLLR